MRVPRPRQSTARTVGACLLAAVAVMFSAASHAADGPALPPAEYKPLPVGTKIEYNDATYTVARTDGLTTVFKKQAGGGTSWVTTYGVFGEYGTDVYVTYVRQEPVNYDLDADNQKKLEVFWPLAVGKQATYQLREQDAYYSPAQLWTITLEVSGTETIKANGRRYQTYVVEERGESDGGMSFVGRKWYHPASGLIVRATRTGTGINQIGHQIYPKVAHLGKDQEQTFALRNVDFPPGTAGELVAAARGARGTAAAGPSPVAAAQAPASPSAGPALPPAEYRPLPVGTKLEYDDATYTVARTEGFTTVFKKQSGGSTTWVTTYGLFGDYGSNVYVRNMRGTVESDLNPDNKKIIETLWPLAVGKKITYRSNENSGYAAPFQEWTISLNVTGTEIVNIGGKDFQTYVIEEQGKSNEDMSFSGRKWYQPDSGLIVRWSRVGTGRNAIGPHYDLKDAHLGKDEEQTFALRNVDFPPGTAGELVAAARGTTAAGPSPVAVAQGPASPSAGLTLPPAEYKSLPVGTKIEYDDATYTVARTDGLTTVFKKQSGGGTSWVTTYGVFGEFGADVYAKNRMGAPANYDLDAANMRKLEAIWPLAVGNKADFELSSPAGYGTAMQRWTTTLTVSGTEIIEAGGRRYATFAIEERAESESGMSFVGRKWYDPATGLIVRSRRIGTGLNVVGPYNNLLANLGKDQEQTFALRHVDFPPGTAAEMVAAAQGTATAAEATPAAPALAEVERLKREAEEARRTLAATEARRAEEARKAEEIRLAEEARKAREAKAEQARVAEVERLKREAEEARKIVEARKAREAEEKAAREAEIARVRREIEERRRAETQLTERETRELNARVAEVARLKAEADERRNAEEARKAREAEDDRTRAAEFARLNQQIAEARMAEAARKARAAEEDKVRVAEVARLKRQAEEAQRAADQRESEVASRLKQADRTRLAEIAKLKQEAEQMFKAREAEMAKRLKETEQARLAEIAKLKLEAEEMFKAREAEMAKRLAQAEEARKAREEEIARLKQEAEQALKAREARESEIAKLKQTLAERGADKTAAAGDAAFKGIEFGRYHALVIGIDNYKQLPKLNTAVNDARAVAGVLEKDYGFNVTLLLEPTRNDIVDALDALRETLGPNDNLLIYYAGHGWLDREVDRGYWLPIDAEPKRRRDWVSNATVTDTLKALSAKHVMVIADSCYSGTLVRGADVGARTRTGDYWKQMATKWARVAITSGGLEPVADAGSGGHSPFAKAFIDALADNTTVMDGTTLFSKMRRPVMVSAQQTPQYADVREAGHDGGDFLFVRKK